MVELYLLRIRLFYFEYDYRERDNYDRIKVLYLDKVLEIDDNYLEVLYYLVKMYYDDFIYLNE